MLPIDHRPPPVVVPCLAPAECVPGRAAEVMADAGAVARLCEATAAERANAIFFTEHSAPTVAPAERCGRCCEILACDDDESCRVRFHADGAVLWLPRGAAPRLPRAARGRRPALAAVGRGLPGRGRGDVLPPGELSHRRSSHYAPTSTERAQRYNTIISCGWIPPLNASAADG